MIKGIDVSDNNGKINWAAVKAAGVQFAILRLGFGDDIASQDDKRFEENVAGCEANGIPWGAYIYSYAMTTTEAESEAAHCMRLLAGKKPTYPVCFDMEDADGYKASRGGLSKDTAVLICETFLDTMEKNGYYVSLYSSLSWLNGLLNDSRLDRFDKWVAQWNTICEYRGNFGLWQYGGSTNYIESPTVNGVSGAVDKDYAYYDYPQAIKAKGLNGWPKPEADNTPEVTPPVNTTPPADNTTPPTDNTPDTTTPKEDDPKTSDEETETDKKIQEEIKEDEEIIKKGIFTIIKELILKGIKWIIKLIIGIF